MMSLSTEKLAENPDHQKAKIWSNEEVAELFELPFNSLLHKAHSIHKENFPENKVQLSSLLSIKSGGCPEDCAYCPQSVRYKTHVNNTPLMGLEEVLEKAKAAKQAGATRFCMGAAWRSPKDRDISSVIPMIEGVKNLGLETCMTLGMLDERQAKQLGEAGLDYYNHNLDTSSEYYRQIITTRTYEHRLKTISNVQSAGVKVCCGGIVGIGEKESDRIDFLKTLANLNPQPESVPINMLVKVEGTPLADSPEVDPIAFVRTIAIARLLLPNSYVRLSAGRSEMSDELQALCFYAGANSIFYGEELLTTENPVFLKDQELFGKLGLKASK